MARIPVIAGNWKMYKTAAEGDAFVARSPRGWERWRTRRSWSPRRSRVWPLSWPPRGHRRSPWPRRMCSGRSRERSPARSPRHAQGARGPLGHHRPLGAAATVRRDRSRAWPARVRAALDVGLRPIVCVGETEAEREAGLTEERLAQPAGQGARLGACVGGTRRRAGLRARVGHRHRQDRHPDIAQDAIALHPRACGGGLRREGRAVRPHPVRWQREARQRRRADGPARHRRRPGGWSEPGGGFVCRASSSSSR